VWRNDVIGGGGGGANAAWKPANLPHGITARE